MSITLSGIYRYPIKSLTGIAINRSMVKSYGLEHDRCMMLVDEQGVFISQRKFPELATVEVTSSINQITIKHSNQAEISIEESSFTKQQLNTEVWGDKCESFLASDRINQWFSKLLKRKVFLVKYDFEKPRHSDPKFSKPTDIVSFADGFPVLLISTGSLADLNSRLDNPVSMHNFRPNLVVSGCGPFTEDSWRSIKIGSVEFELVKPCSRCVLTTVNPQTGIKQAQGQPLKTLASYRRSEAGVLFGMNLIPRNLGTINQDDVVEILN